MVKYYVYVTSDKAEKGKELTGSRYIDIGIGIDDERGIAPMEEVNIRLNKEDDTGKTTLWVDGKKVKTINPSKKVRRQR